MSIKITLGMIFGLAIAAFAWVTVKSVGVSRAEFNDAARAAHQDERDYGEQHGAQFNTPAVLTGNYRVNCPTVDGGTAVSVFVPMDGGSTAYPIIADTVYVAPTAGSSVKVRVGTSGVTSALGFEVGSSARDGSGISLDAKGPIGCISEGAAQQVDVITGRH